MSDCIGSLVVCRFSYSVGSLGVKVWGLKILSEYAMDRCTGVKVFIDCVL